LKLAGLGDNEEGVNIMSVENEHPQDEEILEEWINPDLPNEIWMNEHPQELQKLHLRMIGEETESIFYDVTDEYEDTVAEAIFDREEDGVEVSVNFLIHPDPKLKKSIVGKLIREAVSRDYDTIIIRLNYHGDVVGGFRVERGLNTLKKN
jgi:hypothetical protein